MRSVLFLAKIFFKRFFDPAPWHSLDDLLVAPFAKRPGAARSIGLTPAVNHPKCPVFLSIHFETGTDRISVLARQNGLSVIPGGGSVLGSGTTTMECQAERTRRVRSWNL